MPEILEVVVEGHDGSAKTPFIAEMQKEIEDRHMPTVICAPFASANEQLRSEGYKDIYQLWVSNKIDEVLKAMQLLRTIVEQTREAVRQSTSSGRVLLIFDRGWMTVLRGLEDVQKEVLRNLNENPVFPQELAFWMQHVPPTIFGIATPEMTKQTKRWHPGIPWDGQEDYEQRLKHLDEHRSRVIYTYERTQVEGMDLMALAKEAADQIFAFYKLSQ